MEFAETPLCKLAYKYGTDKCPKLKHTYTPFYFELLKDRQKSIEKVLEVGIGYYKSIGTEVITFDRNLNRHYHKGASLKMWRDFFFNAQIYGVDIKPETMFRDTRIKTFVCNTKDKGSIEKLIKKTGSDIDLFIDDGIHEWRDQAFLAKTVLPFLKKDVTYIIEDVRYPARIIEELSQYKCDCPYMPKDVALDNGLVLVRNL